MSPQSLPQRRRRCGIIDLKSQSLLKQEDSEETKNQVYAKDDENTKSRGQIVAHNKRFAERLEDVVTIGCCTTICYYLA